MDLPVMCASIEFSMENYAKTQPKPSKTHENTMVFGTDVSRFGLDLEGLESLRSSINMASRKKES